MFNRRSAQIQIQRVKQQLKLKDLQQSKKKANIESKPIKYYKDLRKYIVSDNEKASLNISNNKNSQLTVKNQGTQISSNILQSSSLSTHSSNLSQTNLAIDSNITRNNSNLSQSTPFFFQNIKNVLSHYFRPSSGSRIWRHTNQYSFGHILVLFGFYSSHLKGRQRFSFLIKNFRKIYLTSALFFGLNQFLFCRFYQYRIKQDKPSVFSLNNFATTAIMTSFIGFLEGNWIVGYKKTLFMTLYSMLMDFKTEVDRFIYLNPNNKIVKEFHQIYRQKTEQQVKQQIRNISQPQKNTKIQADKIIKIMLDKNKGQKIANTNLAIILPQVYRYPTKLQKLQHTERVSKEIIEVQQQRGLNFFKLVDQEKIQKEKQQLLQKQRIQKQSISNQQKNNKSIWSLF